MFNSAKPRMLIIIQLYNSLTFLPGLYILGNLICKFQKCQLKSNAPKWIDSILINCDGQKFDRDFCDGNPSIRSDDEVNSDKVRMYEEIMTNDDNLESSLLKF